MLVYGGLGVLVLVSLFGGIRAITMSSKVSNLTNQVKTLQTSLKEAQSMSNSVDISRVQYYMSNFVWTYINYDRDNSQERTEALSNYYSFDTDGVVETVASNRTLKSQRFVSVEEKDGYNVAIVMITYEQNGQSYVINLAIPFEMSDGLISIISQPYTLATDYFQGKSKSSDYQMKDEKGLTVLSDSEKDSVKDFLNDFFDKYAESNETDLKVLMKNPVLMGAGNEVKQVNSDSARYYEEDGKYVVQVSVVFKNKETKDEHTENFTLYLVKSNKTYYVEDFYNYFKN